MHDINKYISGLLFIHDCVILPGFGGFVTNYHGAEHDLLSHTFQPPKKDILYNKHITYNDGLLISYLAKNLAITYDEAEKRVKDEVQKAWIALDKGQRVNFEGVGSFAFDSNRNLVFTPEDTENYLIDSYGLASFRFPPLDYQKSARDTIPLYKHTQHMTEGAKKTLQWGAAAVLVAVLGIVALIPYQKNKNLEQTAGYQFDTANEQPIESAVSAMPVDTNMAAAINQNTDKRVALFYAEEKAEPIKKQDTEGFTFYIIGGSYKEMVNAQEQAEKYKAQGYNATVLPVDDLFRVSLCQFDNKVTALHELRRIRSEEQNENVWLFSQK